MDLAAIAGRIAAIGASAIFDEGIDTDRRQIADHALDAGAVVDSIDPRQPPSNRGIVAARARSAGRVEGLEAVEFGIAIGRLGQQFAEAPLQIGVELRLGQADDRLFRAGRMPCDEATARMLVEVGAGIRRRIERGQIDAVADRG